MSQPRTRLSRLGSALAGLALAVAVMMVLNWSSLGPRLTEAASTPKVGELAPEVEFADLAGHKVKLSELRGTAVFLNFWATWCPPCVEEMGSISSLAGQFKGKGLRVVAVNVDASPAATIQQWVEKRKLGMEVLLDPSGAVARRFGTFKFPETYLLDRNGKIQAKFVGSHEWTEPPFDAMLTALVGLGVPKPAPSPAAPATPSTPASGT